MTLASTLHSQLGWPQVVLHDAVVLMDRVMQTGPHFNVVSSRVGSQVSSRGGEGVLAEWISLPKQWKLLCLLPKQLRLCCLHIGT